MDSPAAATAPGAPARPLPPELASFFADRLDRLDRLDGLTASFDVLDRPCEDDPRFPPETGMIAREIQAAARRGPTRGLGAPAQEADRVVASILSVCPTWDTPSD